MDIQAGALISFSSLTRKIRRDAKKSGQKLSYKEARLKKPVNKRSYLSTSYDDFNSRLQATEQTFDTLFRRAYNKLKGSFNSQGEKNVFFVIRLDGFSQYAIRVRREGLRKLKKIIDKKLPYQFQIVKDEKHFKDSGLPFAKIRISNKNGKTYLIEDNNNIFGEVMPFVPGRSLAMLSRPVGYMGLSSKSDPETHLEHSNRTLNRLLKLPQASYTDLLRQMKASKRYPDFGLGNIILTPDKRLVMIDPHSGYRNTLAEKGQSQFAKSLVTNFGKFLHQHSDPKKVEKVIERFRVAYANVFEQKIEPLC